VTADEIRYCTTEDGIRIAYTVRGEGLPLVQLAPFIESFSPGGWTIREERRDQHRRSLTLSEVRATSEQADPCSKGDEIRQ